MKTFPELVAAELARARSLHAPHNSWHESLAVIREEYKEVEEEVFKREDSRLRVKFRSELVQLAAMCQRAAEDNGLVECSE